MAASPGAAVGRAVFDSATAKAWGDRGERSSWCVRETNPDDLEGMIAAAGILTARGGKTSHAAVVARGMGKTCVCGAEALDVDAGRAHRAGRPVLINEGDGSASTAPPARSSWARCRSCRPRWRPTSSPAWRPPWRRDDETTALVKAVDRLLTHADVRRRLCAIRANADTTEDAVRARSLWAPRVSACAAPSTCSSAIAGC